MEEEKIRALIRQEIASNQNRNEYRGNAVPFHTHNGVDSPLAYSPYNTYIGLIQLDAVPLIIPSGWTVEYISTGVYNINHNLGTELYVMTVAPILSVTAPIASVTPGENVTSVTWYNVDPLGTPGFVDTTFQFTLTEINNGTQNVPIYDRNGQSV